MRICEDCGQKVLVKDTARIHFQRDHYTYRCTACHKARVDVMIERQRNDLGLPPRQADQGS